MTDPPRLSELEFHAAAAIPTPVEASELIDFVQESDAGDPF
jgi:hypothetical protein